MAGAVAQTLGLPVQAAATNTQGFDAVAALNNPTADDRARQTKWALAWAAYKGRLADPLKKQRDGLNDNAKSNRLEPIVQKGASWLFPSNTHPVIDDAGDKVKTASGEGEVQTGNQEAQAFLDMFWKANKQSVLLHKYAINGGVFGQAFFKLVPATDRSMPPKLVNLNPQNIRVETDPDDCDTVNAYIISSPTGILGARTVTALERRQVIERILPPADSTGDGDEGGISFGAMLDNRQTWRISDQQRKSTDNAGAGSWTTIHQEDWPYPFAPIFTNQNLPEPNDFWGAEDIPPDLIEQQMVINFVQSNTSRIIKWHASPLTWGKGIGNTNIDRSPENIVTFTSDTASLQNLEMTTDLASSLAFAETCRQNMDEQSRVPSVALGRQEALPKGNLSGVALQLLFQPLLEKTEQKRSTYGPTLCEISSAVLVIAGFADRVEDMPTSVNWPQVLPTDPIANWQVVPIKMQAGVSRDTILEENGYDPEQEDIMRAAEALSDAQLTSSVISITTPPTPQAPVDANGDPMPAPPAQPAQQSNTPSMPANQSGLVAPASHISPRALAGLNHPNAVAKRLALKTPGSPSTQPA